MDSVKIYLKFFHSKDSSNSVQTLEVLCIVPISRTQNNTNKQCKRKSILFMKASSFIDSMPEISEQSK